MRISRTGGAVAAAVTIACMIPAGAAVAGPGTDCPPGGNGGGYPGSSCTLAVSDSSVAPGEQVTVSGSDFQPGSEYVVTIHSRPRVLATGKTPGSGTVSRQVTIPSNIKPGDHTLIMRGLDNEGGPRELDAAITVVGARNSVAGAFASAGSTGAGSAPGTSASGMPNTGADQNLLPLLGAGGGLVIVGAGVVAASRRRRYSAHRPS